MPERIFFALLAAATLWLPLRHGNAQGVGLPGRRDSLAPMRSQPAYPVATPIAAEPYGASALGFAPAMGVTADPNRKLQPGDQLLVKIEQDKEAAIAVAVSQTGDVIVEPLPQGVRVAGMTVGQAASEIKQRLEKDYYYKADVRLTLERGMAPPVPTVSLSGYVNRVGAVPLYPDRPTKLSEVIVNSGGFKMYANERKVQVTREVKGGPPEKHIVDVKAVLKDGKLDQDLVVRDGDKIFVPDVFFRTN
jgi:protein involved in polysaccharide export with SLBB domain